MTKVSLMFKASSVTESVFECQTRIPNLRVLEAEDLRKKQARAGFNPGCLVARGETDTKVYLRKQSL